MDKQFAIFDMDGTLVDSMTWWKRLGLEYLRSKGVADPVEQVLARTKAMTIRESSALFIEEFGLKGTPEQIGREMNDLMDEHYRLDVPLKSGVREYLEALHRKGVTMCVASATAERLMEACLTRLGVADYFSFLLSCETVGVGKNSPDVFLEAARRMGAGIQETASYEDALYAAETAKKAGFYTIGVYDESSDRHWKQLQQLTDEHIRDWVAAAKAL